MFAKKRIIIVLAAILIISFALPTFALTDEGTTVEGFEIDPELFRCASAITNGWTLDHDKDGVVTLDEWKTQSGIELHCEGYDIKDWSALKYIEEVHRLAIYDCNNADLSAISEIGSIGFLRLTTNDFSTISGLDVGTSNALFVHIGSKSPVDITKLSTFSSSETFGIVAPECNNYNELSDFKVRKMSIHVENKTDIADLKNESITELNVTCPELEDISFVKNCPNLYTLDLSGCNVSDPSAIESLSNLEELNLTNNNISDVDWLKKTGRIPRLYLEGNAVVVEDLIKFLYKEETFLSGVVGGSITFGTGTNRKLIEDCDIIDMEKLLLKSYDEAIVEPYPDNVVSMGLEAIGQTKVDVIYDGNVLRTYDVEVKEHQPGDIDCDAVMTAEDALEILRYAAKIYYSDPRDEKNGDANGDGILSADDALVVLKMAAKITE